MGRAETARSVGRAGSALLRYVTSAFALVSAAAVVTIMLIIAIDVAKRSLLGGSVPGAIEYSEILLVVVVFLGLAEAQRRGQHISMEMVTTRLPAHAAARLKAVGLFVGLTIISWMCWETWQVALRAWETGEYRFGLARIPTWPAKVIIPIGLVLFVFQIVRDLRINLAHVRKERPPTSG